MQTFLPIQSEYKRYLENIKTVMVENGYSDFSTIFYSNFPDDIDNVIAGCNITTKTRLGLFIVGNGLEIELYGHPLSPKGLMWSEVNLSIFNVEFDKVFNYFSLKTNEIWDKLTSIKQNILGNDLLITRFDAPPHQELLDLIPCYINCEGEIIYQDTVLPCYSKVKICFDVNNNWIGNVGCDEECWSIATKTSIGMFMVGNGLEIELSNQTLKPKGLIWMEVDNKLLNEATNKISTELINQKDDKQAQLNLIKQNILGNDLLITRFDAPLYQELLDLIPCYTDCEGNFVLQDSNLPCPEPIKVCPECPEDGKEVPCNTVCYNYFTDTVCGNPQEHSCIQENDMFTTMFLWQTTDTELCSGR